MIVQSAIVIFSCISITLFSSKTLYKWGFVAGILGQPFWVYATFTTEQWGMLLVAVWFSISHLRGIFNHIVKE